VLSASEKQELKKDCRVVAISGYVGQSHEAKCKNHGMDMVLGKPPSDVKVKKILSDCGFV